MCDQLTVGINSGFQACKLVRVSSIFVGFIKLLILPLGYIVLKLGYSVYWVVILYAVVELLAGVMRMILANKYMGLNVWCYFRKVLFRVIPPIIITCGTCYLIIETVTIKYRIIITIIASFTAFILSTYYLSLQGSEREHIRSLVFKIRTKVYEKFN